MSEVFQEINIENEHSSRSFNIEVSFEGQCYPVQVYKKNEFSLSNFNSFSHHEESSFEFT